MTSLPSARSTQVEALGGRWPSRARQTRGELRRRSAAPRAARRGRAGERLRDGDRQPCTSRAMRSARGAGRRHGDRRVSGEPRVVEQAAQDDGRAGLHHVEDPREERAARRGCAATRVRSTKTPLRRLGVARASPSAGPSTGVAEEARRGRAEQPEGGEAHRRDRPVQALGDAEAEVDAQLAGRGQASARPRARPLGIGNSVVIGRAWVSQSVPAASMAHSCPAARRSAPRPGRRARPARAPARRRGRASSPPLARRAACRRRRPAGSRAACRPAAARGSAPVAVSTTKWSGLTAPDTTASPRPGLASMTAWRRRPVTGLAVNSTPADLGVDHPLDDHGERDTGGGRCRCAAR